MGPPSRRKPAAGTRDGLGYDVSVVGRDEKQDSKVVPLRQPKSGPKRKGRNKDSKHVRLYWYLLESAAYHSASPLARCLLVELCYRYNGGNNGYIALGVRDAARLLKTGTRQAHKAFGELERLGFIRCRMRGAFTVKQKLASEWIISEYEYAGQKATKDYLKIDPEI